MSFDLTKAAIDLIDQKLSGPSKAVLVVIASHTNGSNTCFPSIQRIADCASITPRTVQRAISQLVQTGYISTTERPGKPLLFTVKTAALPSSNPRLSDTPDSLTPLTESPKPPSESHPRQKVTPDSLTPHPRQRVTPPPSESHPTPDSLTPEQVINKPRTNQEQVSNMSPPDYVNLQNWVETWNSRQELPKIRRALSDSRAASLRARIKDTEEFATPEAFGQFLDGYLLSSDFLMGRVKPKDDRNPWRADLGWICKPANLEKIFEGKYGGQKIIQLCECGITAKAQDPDGKWLCQDCGMNQYGLLVDGVGFTNEIRNIPPPAKLSDSANIKDKVAAYVKWQEANNPEWISDADNADGRGEGPGGGVATRTPDSDSEPG